MAQSVEGDWLARGFEKAEVRNINASDAGADLMLPVSFIRLAGSNWTHERVMRHIRRTASIFAACGIGLGPIQVIEAKAPGGRHDLDMAGDAELPVPRDVLEISAMIPATALRPPVVFAGQLRNDEALARSFRRGDTPPAEAKNHLYLDTSWVAFKTHWIERKDDSYSTVAHELTHLLCECGHERTKQRNILNRYRNFLSGEILPETCARMRRSPLLRGARDHAGAPQ